METTQIAHKFDKATVKKILKGALIAAGAPAAIGILEYFGALQISNAFLAAFMAWFVPTAINAIKEWRKGQKP